MLKIAFLMDRIETIKSLEDTTFALMEEAYQRGHRIFHLEPIDLTLHSKKKLRLQLKEVSVDPIHGIRVKKSIPDKPLDFLDCLWIRKDPPFDLSYFHFLLLLSLYESEILILNKPSSLILGNEKLLPFLFPEYMPETFVSFRKSFLKSFMKNKKPMVWKPLFERSGRGLKLHSQDLTGFEEGTWGLVQQFLPQVRTSGDKRVLVLDGKAIASYVRMPPQGQWLIRPDLEDNTLKAASMTSKEKHIISKVGPKLRKLGFYFSGLDFIGEQLTEINVTSPGGLPEANLFTAGKPLQKIVINFLEKKLLL